MLLQGRYDFTPRKEDSHKTLGFNKGDTLMFLETYPKDVNWLRVVDSKGRVGYIPRNYVELSILEVSRDTVLQFLLEAILNARREKFDSLEMLELLKDDVRRIEFREFQTRLLRQALQFRAEPEVEIDDGTTYTCESDYKERGRGGGHGGAQQAESVVSVGSRSERSHISTRTTPNKAVATNSTGSRHGVVNNYHHHDPGEIVHPLTGRCSQSCNQIANYPQKLVGSPLHRRVSSTPRQMQDEPNFEKMAAKLINIVQESGGGIDLKRSETIVHRILYHMKNHFANSALPESISSVLRVLERSPTRAYTQSVLGAAESETSRNVKEILHYLTKFTNHSLHTRGYIEEESIILDKLDQLEEDLERMDGSTMKRTIAPKAIEDLMGFYQSEKRDSIKSKMIEIFSMIATLDTETKGHLVKSALPILLAKELAENDGSPRKLSRLAVTLTKLLSSAGNEILPQTHLDALGPRFLNFLLNYLEDSPQSQIEEDATTKSDFVTLILAYNLQFTPSDENLLTKTLAGREPGRFFMESIMSLFEKGVDPVSYSTLREGSQRYHPHSVLKLLQDIFSSKKTAEHFHKADMKWLTDLLYKNVSELGPGNQRRTEYLELLRLVVRNRVFQYRVKDIRDALFGILLEEDPLSIPDQKIVRNMSKEFPAIFKKGSGQNLAKVDTAF